MEIELINMRLARSEGKKGLKELKVCELGITQAEGARRVIERGAKAGKSAMGRVEGLVIEL